METLILCPSPARQTSVLNAESSLETRPGVLRPLFSGVPLALPVLRTNLMATRSASTFCLLVYALIATCCVGCGGRGGPERVEVSGTVTYNGTPIPEGTIRFVPGQHSMVPLSGAPISEGAYRVDQQGGVPVGTHKIEIEAFRKVQPSGQRATGGLHSNEEFRQQYLPDRFNRRSELEITIEPDSGNIVQDFELND